MKIAILILFFLAIFALIEWQERRANNPRKPKQKSKVVEMETEYDYNNSA